MSQSSSESKSGPVTIGDTTPSWVLPAIVVGALALFGLGWLLTRKGN